MPGVVILRLQINFSEQVNAQTQTLQVSGGLWCRPTEGLPQPFQAHSSAFLSTHPCTSHMLRPDTPLFELGEDAALRAPVE